jgi:tetratricopeptide (TPR) repeat protein
MKRIEGLKHWIIIGIVVALWSIPYAAAEIDNAETAAPEAVSSSFPTLQAGDVAQLKAARIKSRQIAARTSYELAKLAAAREQWSEAGIMIMEAVHMEPTNTAVLKMATKVVFKLQDYEKAEEYLLRLVSGRQRVGNLQNREMALYMENLAVIYSAQHRIRLARSTLESSLTLREHSQDSSHTEVVSLLYQLADVNLRLGDSSQAKRYLIQVLHLLEASDDENARHDIAAATHNIGEIYRAEGRFVEAKAAYEKALDLWREMPDAGNRGLAMTNRSLEALHVAMKQKATVVH